MKPRIPTPPTRSDKAPGTGVAEMAMFPFSLTNPDVSKTEKPPVFRFSTKVILPISSVPTFVRLISFGPELGESIPVKVWPLKYAVSPVKLLSTKVKELAL